MTISPHLRLGNDALSAQAKQGVLPVEKPGPRRKKRGEREAIYTYAMDLPGETAECFLAQFSDVPCAGRMQKAHLVRAQTIRREVPGASKVVIWDERAWRPACYRHHTDLDQARTLRIPRSAIPTETEAYAAELGLGWWLDRTFGERKVAA